VAFSEWEFYRKAPDVGLLRFSLVGGFTILLAIFCLYSFAKARNVH
jgi:putative flippase GtrA